MAAYGFAFTASHFRKACAARRKVTKALLPRHSAPRSGIAPGARRHRPSMAGGGYRGILAAVLPTQYLRSASGKGAADQDQDQKPKQRQRQGQQLREQARSHSWTGYIRGRLVDCQAAIAAMGRPDKPAPTKKSEHIRSAFHHSIGRALARLQLLMLTHRPLEGMPSLGEAPNERGRSALVTFRRAAQAFSKVTRCKSETNRSRYRRNGYVHNHRARSALRPPRHSTSGTNKNGPYLNRGRSRYSSRRYRKTGLIRGLPAW
jgi:hypothetical protein